MLKILIKPWKEAQIDAFSILQEVFVQEQGVPAELELDEFDPAAFHALAFDNGCCIGTGRLMILVDGQAQIGRMAVLAQYRNQGIGLKLLERLTDLAKSHGANSILLHSQLSAIPFYEKLDFKPEGPTYDEAGIAHRNMILLLPNLL